MSKKILVCLLLAVLISSGMIYAKGQSEEDVDQTVSIMFQGPDTEQAAIRDSANRFTASTGIEVELLFTPHDSYTEKLAGYISAKQLPDVIQIDAPNLSNLVWSGYVSEISPYISSGLIDDMTLSNKSQSTYPVDGKLYAISQIDSTVLLYANRTYLERIGARIPSSVADAWSIEEFDAILDDLSSLPEVSWPLDIMKSYGTTGEWATYGFSPTMQSAGGDLIGRSDWVADGTINSAKSIEAMEYFQKWSQKGYLVPSSGGDNQLYSADRAAAIAWCGHWLWASASAALGDDLVVIPLPDFGTGVATPNGSWIWSITSTSKNKDRAGELIEFMLTDEQFLKDWAAIGAYPALKSFAQLSPDYLDPDKMAIAFEQADYAVSRPPHPAYPTITVEYAKAFDAILNGTDAAAALTKAAKAIDDDIEDNDGYPPFGK
jgi:multiple sugar transport system substrate-binding protein